MLICTSTPVSIEPARDAARTSWLSDVSFLEFPADTGQSDNGPKVAIQVLPVYEIRRLDAADYGTVSSISFKAETTGSAHADAVIGLHIHGRCGSASRPTGYAASQT